MTTGNREDYLINILRLTEGDGVAKTTELASYMNVSPASVSEMIKVLAKEGLVDYEKYKGVSLTDEGLTLARQLRKKHHVVERFLTDYLNGDTYFKIAYPEHNLVRARNQFALVADMERKMDQMEALIAAL